LEKHVEKEVLQEMSEEEKHIEEDVKAGDAIPFGDEAEGGKAGNATLEQDPLEGILEGFWFIFNDYEGEFSGKPRESLKEGHPIFEQLKVLGSKINSQEPPSEEQTVKELDAIDLSSVGAGLGSGRVLPAAAIVDELLLINTIPHVELKELEKSWREGKVDSVTVFGKISEMHKSHLVPSGWLQKGVDKDEQIEVKEELAQEAEIKEHAVES